MPLMLLGNPSFEAAVPRPFEANPQLDEFTRRHFMAWGRRFLPGQQIVPMLAKVTSFVGEHPEALNWGWPRVVEYITGQVPKLHPRTMFLATGAGDDPYLPLRKRNIAVRQPKIIHRSFPATGAMVATGTSPTGVNMPPFQYVEEYARQGRLGLIAFGAYNAFGLIGPEQGGVALVDEKARQVLGTVTIPYSREARGAMFERIFGSRDWFLAAREAGFGMRFEKRPNPGAAWHRERADLAWIKRRQAQDTDPVDQSYWNGRLRSETQAWAESVKRKINPEAAWHDQQADEAGNLAEDARLRGRADRQEYFAGMEQAHVEASAEEENRLLSSRRHLGPGSAERAEAGVYVPPRRFNPGGAALSGRLGLYPSYNVNLAHLVKQGKLKTLTAYALAQGYQQIQSQSGYPWPGIYFLKGQQVLVLETVPPSHAGNPGEAWHYQEADEARQLRAHGHTQSFKDYYEGQESAHLHSAYEAGVKHMNPALRPGSGPAAGWARTIPLDRATAFQEFHNIRRMLGIKAKMVPAGKGLFRVVWQEDPHWGQGIPRYPVPSPTGYYSKPQVTPQTPALKTYMAERKRILGNPTPAAGFQTFHHASPDRNRAVKVPQGWPRQLWMLGSLKKLELSDGSVIRGGLVAASRGNKMFILNAHYAGKPGRNARALQIEYVTPSVSERAGPVWFHPFKRPPAVREWTKGFLTLAGKGIKLTRQGIVG